MLLGSGIDTFVTILSSDSCLRLWNYTQGNYLDYLLLLDLLDLSNSSTLPE